MATISLCLVNMTSVGQISELIQPGNIIANPGFIQQFGREFDGELALDALHVSAWGGVLSGSNIIGCIIGGL